MPSSGDTASEAGADAPRPLRERAVRSVAWLAAFGLALLIVNEIGVPVGKWISDFLKQLGEVPLSAIVAGVVLETAQTTLAALSWLTILRVAFPDTHIPFRPILASYALGVGLNGFLIGNAGTWVMLVMFGTLIAGATFAAIMSGFVVQKIPFTVLSIASYAYLFATVNGALSFEGNFISRHPWGTVVLIGLVAVAIVVLVRRYWARLAKLREQIASGGAVLGRPRRFLVGVFLPQLGSYAARLAIVAVFLAAYSIPVSFHTTVAVTTANSISKSVNVTPGSAGVTQALNVVVLQRVTSKANATAYSAGQQLIITAWDAVLAMALVAWAFGWAGGRELVRQSYGTARVKEDELRRQRQERRAARRK